MNKRYERKENRDIKGGFSERNKMEQTALGL
jgi:hypothetical protein